MATVTGTIKNIEDCSHGPHKKNKLTIKTGNDNLVFIEFRGPLKIESDSFKINDLVTIEHHYEGKISKASGITYNNLPAVSIKRLTNKQK